LLRAILPVKPETIVGVTNTLLAFWDIVVASTIHKIMEQAPGAEEQGSIWVAPESPHWILEEIKDGANVAVHRLSKARTILGR